MSIWDCYKLGPECVNNNHNICITEIKKTWRKSMLTIIYNNPEILIADIIDSDEFHDSWLALTIIDELRDEGLIR